MASPYNLRKVAAPNTLEHRVYIEKDGLPVSPFHDIPLYANQEQTVLNMVVEIPRWTNAKLEVCIVCNSRILQTFFPLYLGCCYFCLLGAVLENKADSMAFLPICPSSCPLFLPLHLNHEMRYAN